MNVESEIPRPPQSPVEVYYNNCKLVPAPLINWSVESEFDSAGTRTSNRNHLTLTGTVLIVPSGSYELMFEKQTELRTAFSEDNKDFLILAGPGNVTLPQGSIISSGLTPKVLTVDVAADTQFQRIDYTIELEDLVIASGVSGITSSLTDQWSFKENNESCTVDITHQINAEGPEGEPDKFLQAFRAVRARIGIDKLPIEIPYFVEPNGSGLYSLIHPANPSGGPIFEVSVQREEVADVFNGTYSVTEVFTIVSGVPFYFSQRTESFEEDQNGIATVTLAGTVQGLGRTITPLHGIGGLGFERACSGFLGHIKPQLKWDASGVYEKYKEGSNGSGLAIYNPTAFTVTQNACRGTVDFSITFTDNPSAKLPSGIVSTSSNISITEGIRLFVSHPIPFRGLGNIIQDIATTTEGTISIQCQAQAKNTGSQQNDTNRAIQFVQDELNRLKAIHGNPANYVTVRIGQLSSQFSEIELTCQATLELIFTIDISTAPDINSDIALRMA